MIVDGNISQLDFASTTYTSKSFQADRDYFSEYLAVSVVISVEIYWNWKPIR